VSRGPGPSGARARAGVAPDGRAARAGGSRIGRAAAAVRLGAMTRLPLLLAGLALLCCSCASSKERWAEAAYMNISFQNLYGLVQTTIDAEGYPARVRDVRTGRIETDWVYGNSNSIVRGPARRKVIARIEPLPEGEDGYLVRLRVAEEVIPRGGLLAMNPRESDDWESYQDNFDTAEYIMAKIAALLSDNRVSADFERQISPCQFGGNPDCANCGCIASAGLKAVGRHTLPMGLRVGAIFDGSFRVGHAVKRLRGA